MSAPARPTLSGTGGAILEVKPERIVVTGATGWLGRATLELLESALGPNGLRAQVEAYASREREIVLRSGAAITARKLSGLVPEGLDGALLLHFAFRTGGWLDPGFLRDNTAITATMLRAFAVAPPRRMLLPSSGAAYAEERRPQTDLAAHPYGTMKYLGELMFEAQCGRDGVPLAIVRVFNVSGQHMTRSYALADLVLAVLEGRPLVVRAKGPVERSYAALADVVSVALGTLLAPDADAVTRFDTAGAEAVEMGHLAERVRAALGRPDLPIERSPEAGAPADVYVGEREPFAALAAAQGVVLQDLDEQIRATAADMAQAIDPHPVRPRDADRETTLGA